MALTWVHQTAYDSTTDPGVYVGGIELPTGFKAYGAWAESCNQYGNRSSHYNSCTPTDPGGHITDSAYLLGTSLSISGSTTYVNFFFRGDPGQQLRVHAWVLT